jgi:hypothetical protein
MRLYTTNVPSVTMARSTHFRLISMVRFRRGIGYIVPDLFKER